MVGRWQNTNVADDPLVEWAIRGDMRILDELDGVPRAELVEYAACYGRWIS